MGFPWDFYLGFLWEFYGISMGFLWDFDGISMRFLCDFHGISMGFLWGFYGISMGILWEFYGVSMGFLWDSYGISYDESPNGWIYKKNWLEFIGFHHDCLWISASKIIEDFGIANDETIKYGEFGQQKWGFHQVTWGVEEIKLWGGLMIDELIKDQVPE
jgi:hypothetical protein